ncbi:MAG: carbonic anhydrase [Acidobacteria bacterium]|nr:MAG: carbonic anhydrase [Acidobacteriota bacterium]
MTATHQNFDSAPIHAEGIAGEIWADLMEGNQRFQSGRPVQRQLVARRTELASQQSPPAIILACSDSRVCPSLIFDKNLGDLFVIRTAGNVADPVALGSIEFAAEYLRSRVLVIMGHEKCGAVEAAASGSQAASPNLESIVAKVRPAIDMVKGKADGDGLLRLAERANVHISAADILSKSPLLQKKVSDGDIALIKAIYHLSTGQVIRLTD